MNMRQVVEQIKADIEANLNSYIESSQREDEDWFTELSIHSDAPRVELDRFYMGIYLASPDGAVFEGTAQTRTITVSLDCFLDDKRENSNLPMLYLSAVLDYLYKRRYGISSNPTYAETARVDLDADVNAFSVAIEVVIYNMDYDI